VLGATGAFFALYVADIEASTRWYSEKLGLKIVMQDPRRDKAAVTVLEGGGLIVELIQHDDAVPLSKAGGAKDNPLVHGMFKAGVIVDDFDKALAMIKARNIPIAFGPFPARLNQRANAIIRDNAGNLIQVFGK
ncbi:MAG TPA: VOC family protein, partial [Candidatus Angelobacter sp.]|nr:VOC family protein [Candidatus Angelobacter sp.]